MTKTIAKKNVAFNNVDMDDIPNLENSEDEQAFKSTESVNKSTPEKLIEELSHQENDGESETQYDEFFNEIQRNREKATKVTYNCDVEGCTYKTDSPNVVAIHKGKSHKITKDAQ